VRGSILPLIVVASSLLAPVAHGNVGVFPVSAQGIDPAVQTEVARALSEILGPTLVQINKPISCDDPKPALTSAAAEIKVLDEVAAVCLSRAATEPQKSEMRVMVFDATGLKVLDLHEVITDDPLNAGSAAKSRRALLHRALQPKTYRGSVYVTDAPANAELRIDGLRLLDNKSFLTVGPHVLSVIEEGKATKDVPFSVRFEEATEVWVPQDAPVVPLDKETWPEMVAVGAASAAAALTLTSALFVGVTSFAASAEDPNVVFTNAEDPHGNNWNDNYGPAANGSASPGVRLMMTALAVNNRARLEAERSIWLSGLLGSAVVTATASTVAALMFAADPTVPDEQATTSTETP